MPSRIKTVRKTYMQSRLGVNGYLPPTEHTYTYEDENSSWTNSPRDSKGHLAFRSNACTIQKLVTEHWAVNALGPGQNSVSPMTSGLYGFPLPPGDTEAWAPLETNVAARFAGKLRKGHASLGVTAASWRQSRDMIVHSHRRAAKQLDSAYETIRGFNKGALTRLRKDREPLANQILETEFGWFPLFEDIRAALNMLCNDIHAGEYVRSRSTSYIGSESVTKTSAYGSKLQWVGRRWVTYSAKVSVENQNLWLLNRLGLINLPAIAWDLVPWSFVVNMFVNANQLINSVTDEVGLSITDRSLTKGRVFRLNNDVWGINPSYTGGRSSILHKYRSRTLDVKPQVSVIVKVPDLNWELAVIASSLVVQKIQRINRLIRLI